MRCDRRRFILLLAASAVGCAAGVPGIRYDVDVCDFCRMTISDPEFAALAVTARGRAARFDSIECLVRWSAQQATPPRGTWVTDYAAPPTVLATDQAQFYRGAAGSSMGQAWVASSSDPATTGLSAREGPYTWNEVRRTIEADATGHQGGTP